MTEAATTVRTCRLCGCTDARACPGGCAWAFDDVCTACLGHTPASWEILQAARADGGDAEIRPPFVCLVTAMSSASQAVDKIAGSLSQQLLLDGDLVSEAVESLLLATIDVMEAGGWRPEHNQLLGAIEKYRDEAR